LKNRLGMAPYILLIAAILLNAGVVLSSTTETASRMRNESIAGPPISPTPGQEDQIWNFPEGVGWEKRFFDKPFSPYKFSKLQFQLLSSSGIPLKAPGLLPGIEFGLEMHSFEALQSIVPTESLAQSFNFQSEQPLLLSPSNISPDYNAGFLRFIW